MWGLWPVGPRTAPRTHPSKGGVHMPLSPRVRPPTTPVHVSSSSVLDPCRARRRCAGGVLCALLALFGTTSWAADSPSDRATLRGLPGVHVIVEPLEPDIESLGLTKTQLQTDVELRLRQHGLRV